MCGGVDGNSVSSFPFRQWAAFLDSESNSFFSVLALFCKLIFFSSLSLFVFFFFDAYHSLQNLSSLTRDQTQAPAGESGKS